MTDVRAECGTYAGRHVHVRSGEPVCDACRAAQRDYVRQWRYRTARTKSIRVPAGLVADVVAVLPDGDLRRQLLALQPAAPATEETMP